MEKEDVEEENILCSLLFFLFLVVEKEDRRESRIFIFLHIWK